MTVETLPEIEVIDLEEIIPYKEPDAGKDHLTHIVNPPMNRHIPGWSLLWTAKDVVDVARMMACEVIALCGHRFIPQHNPDKYPICNTCIDIAGVLLREAGE